MITTELNTTEALTPLLGKLILIQSGPTLSAQYHTIRILRFDPSGQCIEVYYPEANVTGWRDFEKFGCTNSLVSILDDRVINDPF
jgi:hypothetical protein